LLRTPLAMVKGPALLVPEKFDVMRLSVQGARADAVFDPALAAVDSMKTTFYVFIGCPLRKVSRDSPSTPTDNFLSKNLASFYFRIAK
jgi:hypothetical protein